MTFGFKLRPLIASIRSGNTEKIHLRSTGLTSADIAQLALALREDELITDIDLSENNISVDAAYSLVEAIRGHPALMHLKLSKCHLGPSGAMAVSEVIRHCRRLRTVALDRNAIGRDGIDVIANAVAESRSLRMLNVSGNSLGSAGATLVAEACGEMSSMKELAIANNAITDPAVLHAIPNCIESLDISGNSLQSFPRAALGPRLRTLKASSNPWVDPPAEVMAMGPRETVPAIRAFFESGVLPKGVTFKLRSPRGNADGEATGDGGSVMDTPRSRAARLAGVGSPKSAASPRSKVRGSPRHAASEPATARGKPGNSRFPAVNNNNNSNNNINNTDKATPKRGGAGAGAGGVEVTPVQPYERHASGGANVVSARGSERVGGGTGRNTARGAGRNASGQHPSRALASVGSNTQWKVRQTDSPRKNNTNIKGGNTSAAVQSPSSLPPIRIGDSSNVSNTNNNRGDIHNNHNNRGDTRVSPWEATADGPRTEEVPVLEISKESHRAEAERGGQRGNARGTADESPEGRGGRRRRRRNREDDCPGADDDIDHNMTSPKSYSTGGNGQHRDVQFRAPGYVASPRAEPTVNTPKGAWGGSGGIGAEDRPQDRQQRQQQHQQHGGAANDVGYKDFDNNSSSNNNNNNTSINIGDRNHHHNMTGLTDMSALSTATLELRISQLETMMSKSIEDATKTARLEEKKRLMEEQRDRAIEEKKLAEQRAEILSSKLRKAEIELARTQERNKSKTCVIQ